ncbi:MAG: NAD(P)/FAD-dependent oxidoreductase [Dehalococcoidia bacterium]|nr:NAD(P)/FAD-dependent oxidoreductase [Dehalococcoidia bacterium]
MEYYDVAIVGAGPAGAFLAYKLASRGHSVALIEKSRLPRNKPCGGGITPKGIQLLDFPVDDLIKETVRSVHILRGKQDVVMNTDKSPVYMVERSEFDQRLAQKAVASGAKLFQDESVTNVEMTDSKAIITTNNGKYEARTLVGADGAKGKTAQWAGIKRRNAFEHLLGIELNAPMEHYPYGDSAVVDFDVPGGYGWVFPKGRYYNVGVVTGRKDKYHNLEQLLGAFAKKRGLDIKNAGPLVGQRVPAGGSRQAVNKGNALLVGDAAWLAEPVFGEGIAFALKSAELAASVIKKYLRGEAKDLDGYTTVLNETLAREYADVRGMKFLLYNFPSLSLRVFAMSSRLRKAAEGMVDGERSLSGVWRKRYDETS